MIVAEEHVILFPETDGTKRSFCCVIVRLRQTVITVRTVRENDEGRLHRVHAETECKNGIA